MENFKSYAFHVNRVDGAYLRVGQGTLAQGEEILNKLEEDDKMAGGEFLAADGNGNVRFIFVDQWDDISEHGLQVFGPVGVARG
jgi:hypothetical protein